MFSVLLIEPHHDTRDRYIDALHDAGLRVYVADDTDVAFDLARLVDVVVTETSVPGTLDGFGFVRAIRATPATRHLPVIVVSTTANRTAERATEAGCDAFCAKPCTPEQLQMALRLVRLQERSRMMAPADIVSMRRVHARPARR